MICRHVKSVKEIQWCCSVHVGFQKFLARMLFCPLSILPECGDPISLMHGLFHFARQTKVDWNQLAHTGPRRDNEGCCSVYVLAHLNFIIVKQGVVRWKEKEVERVVTYLRWGRLCGVAFVKRAFERDARSRETRQRALPQP